jgi:hypothetical protein
MGFLVFSSHSQSKLENRLVKEFTIDNSHHFLRNKDDFFREMNGNHIHYEGVIDSRIICRKYQSKSDGDKGYITISYPTIKGYYTGDLIYWDTPIKLMCNYEKKNFEKKLETVIDGMKGYNNEENINHRKRKFSLGCDELGDNCLWIINGKYKLDGTVPAKHKDNGIRRTVTPLNQKECEKILKWLKKFEIDDCKLD